MITLAIDPGVHHCGVAIFEGKTLTHALLLPPNEITPRLVIPHKVVIELPQVYRATRSKGDPNDLIQVALAVGQIMERFRASCPDFEIMLVKPREWKGTIKKEPHHERELAKLSPEELAKIPNLPKSLLHNVLDAIFLGKKMLTKPKR